MCFPILAIRADKHKGRVGHYTKTTTVPSTLYLIAKIDAPK